MSKLTKSISAILLSLILILAPSVMYVSAAEGELILDDKLAYKVGDTIKYDLSLQSPEGVIGIQMDLKYDPEYLKLNTDSVKSPNFLASTINPNLDGCIILVWSNATDAANFIEKAEMLSAEFEVLKEGKTNITYLIEEMYSFDITYLKEYTISVDYSQNGTVVKENDVPIVEKDPAFVDEHQGQFPNYADGKGQDNKDVESDRTLVTSANKVNEPAENNANNNSNNNQNAATQATDANGNVVATNAQGKALETDASGNYLDEEGETLSTDASGNYVDKSGSIYQENKPAEPENKVDVVSIIIIIVIILAAIAIVAIIIIPKSRKNNNDSESSDETNDNTDTQVSDEAVDNNDLNDSDVTEDNTDKKNND